MDVNADLPTFRNKLLYYYSTSLFNCYDPDDPCIWKSVCQTCNSCRSLLDPILYLGPAVIRPAVAGYLP